MNSVESTGRWNNARRKRNHNRFLIRERIKEESTLQTSQDDVTTIDDTKPASTNNCNKSYHEDEYTPYLKAISLGSTSVFSLQVFSSHYSLLANTFPTTFLSTYKITTLCTSRFGNNYAEAVLKYVDTVDLTTMLEYAILLGEYGLAQSFVAGGINPCDIMQYNQENDTCIDRQEYVTSLVMKKLVKDFVPTSLVIYITKAVYLMRMWSSVSSSSVSSNNDDIDVDNHESDCKCQVCSFETMKMPLLTFPGCNHTFCEACLWESLVEKLDTRIIGDVVRCPICDLYFTKQGKDDKSVSESIDPKLMSEKILKFHSLPMTSKELKKLGRKGKKKNHIYSTWHDALILTFGSSQDVRRDKFIRYVNHGAIHHCRVCLEAGVDINMTNEYNQSPLYIACWRNHINVVELLISNGANVNQCANGTLSALNVCIENGHTEAAQLLMNKLSSSKASSIKDRIQGLNIENTMPNRRGCVPTHVKIIHDNSHPGHGAFYIDYIAPETVMIFLDALLDSIPVASATEIKQKKADKNIPCSLRHYFCDAEGYLCQIISNSVTSVLSCCDGNDKQASPYVMVFPHMRFFKLRPTRW